MHSRMNDTQINLNLTLAMTCFVVGFGLILAACFQFAPDPVADLGLAVVAVGIVRMIARWFCDLEQRERNAFELGMDAQMQAELRRYDET